MIKWKRLKSQAVHWKGKCTCSVHRRILNRQSRIVLLDFKNLTSLTRTLKNLAEAVKKSKYPIQQCAITKITGRRNPRAERSVCEFDTTGNVELRLKSHGWSSTNFLFNNVRTFFKRYCSASVVWERPISPANLKLELLSSLPAKNLTKGLKSQHLIVHFISYHS